MSNTTNRVTDLLNINTLRRNVGIQANAFAVAMDRGINGLAIAVYLFAVSNGAYASTAMGNPSSETIMDVINTPLYSDQQYTQSQERDLSGWAMSFDNDLLVPSSRDQDYTYGVSVTVSGRDTKDYALALHKPLSWINQKVGVVAANSSISRHSVEAGLYGFTPENIINSEPEDGDRPYASIVYWSSTQELAGAAPDTVWRTSLTLGLLGLDVVGDLQNEVHRLTGSDNANGWHNQISDGGELTARYSVSHHRHWDIGNPRLEVKTSTQASVGYLTEASYGLSVRYGRIQSRWQSYNPELTTYGEHINHSVDSQYVAESYAVMGVAVKARAYNAFLQGQFRHSEVELDHGDLNHALVEAWLGYTHSFRGGYRVSYLLRAHSSEVKEGVGDRTLLWGGLTLSRSY